MKSADLVASELVHPSPELNAAIHNGKVIISIRKDPESFVGVFLDTRQARELAAYILELANKLSPPPVSSM